MEEDLPMMNNIQSTTIPVLQTIQTSIAPDTLLHLLLEDRAEARLLKVKLQFCCLFEVWVILMHTESLVTKTKSRDHLILTALCQRVV